MYSLLIPPRKGPDGSVFRVIEHDGGSPLVETVEGGLWGPRPGTPSIADVRAMPPASAVEVAEALGRSRLPASLTRAEVRDVLDLYGPDAMMDAMMEHARLSHRIGRMQAQLARDIAGGVSETSPEIRKAKGDLAALEARRDQHDREFLGEAGSSTERPSTSATSTAASRS
jgi:hypothetical protein